MTVHVPGVASSVQKVVAWAAAAKPELTGTDPNPLAKKISLQSWVVFFVTADIFLLSALSLLPTWPAHWLLPNLFVTPVFEGQFEVSAIAVVVYLFSARAVQLYRTRRILNLRNSVQKALVALLLTFAFMMALGAAAKTTHIYSRLWFFTWMCTSVVLLPSLRIYALRGAHQALGNGHFVHRAISVGVGCKPLAACDINTLTHGQVRVESPIQLKALNELALLPDQIRRRGIDKLYIRAPWALAPEIAISLGELRNLSADVYLVPEAAAMNAGVIGVEQFAGHVTLQIIDRPIDGWNYWLKRLQDITVATAALLVLAPLLVGVAIAIKCESRGPILFRQKRMGFNGRTFELWKFRSMYRESTDPDSIMQTRKNDPRITRVGRFIRQTSIDELPQLINVLQGRMSVVGPRPHALQTTAEGKMLADAIDNYAARHRVKPGITGWAQVHGLRGELTSIEQLTQRVQFDREYIQRWSMLLDARIIVMTLGRIANDPNAY